MKLVGKFFLHIGDRCSHSGEIVDQISDDLVLLRIDRCEHVRHLPQISILVAVSSMMATIKKDGAIEPHWEFFNSREDLDAYDKWLSTPHDDDDDDDDQAAASALN